ncbi:hypothetical protein HYU17_03110 [Candidatus Woesearchaeota archaeon]|nr:hypothetical protein [Candidatus Woesearchaeota archaeon]
MKKEAAVAVLLLASLALAVLLSASAAAQAQQAKPVVEAHCTDTGAFSITNLDDRGSSVSIKKSGGSSKAVGGLWREMANGLYKFTSEDMAVVDVKGGAYTITVDKKSYGVTCPAFEFSCRLINLTINSCYKRNDTFIAKYTAYSYRYDKKNEFRFEKPFMLRYDATATVGGKKRELTHSLDIKSPEFEKINISRVRRVGSNTYTLRWQAPFNISKLSVRYDDCETEKYKFYDSFVCTSRPSCSKDGECLQDERCDDSSCIPISCASCQYVSNHTCMDYDCCTDLDCDSGYVCSSRNCQPLSCGFDESVAGHGCEKLECAEDEYVFNQSCSKLNCQKGQTAANHVCKDVIVVCSGDEFLDYETNSCQKLRCGFLKKAKDHKCVSIFSLWFGGKRAK